MVVCPTATCMNGHPAAGRGRLGAVPSETTLSSNHGRMAVAWETGVGRGRRTFFSGGVVYVHYLDCEDGFTGVYIYQHL